MANFFGTDGVRGLANAGKMTPSSMLRLGQVVGRYFAADIRRVFNDQGPAG